ncbi:hypothetical protein [Yersinia enterocolitica]|uniref:hypothetical protein n=1 Tax=Yersinia enterocolitica TaxID=630 RepID=UPI003D7B828B
MNFKLETIKFITAFIIGFFVFKYLINHIELNNFPTPWVIITLLLFPFGYCSQALFKIPETNENSTLTRSELRRLKPIIKTKKIRLLFLIVYYMFAAVIASIGLFLIPSSNAIYKIFFSICGGLLLSSLYSFFYIHSIMDEIQNFKSVLIHRAEEEKRTKELLDSLTKKADD